MEPAHRAIKHNDFNSYVYNEVVPFIRNATSNETFIYTCGASLGALHAMNLFLKRPDILNGAIAMSGVYDLTEYTRGYWDEQVYYNSPMHYIPNLTDPFYLINLKPAIIYTSTPAAANMKTLILLKDLQACCSTKVSGATWMCGVPMCATTGQPGETCCLIYWTQNFKR